MKQRIPLLVVAAVLGAAWSGAAAVAKEHAKAPDEPAQSARLSADNLRGLTFREIGPAIASGRISDIAVDPGDRRRWIVAVASGGVWITTNAGTTWKPVFDDQGSYSIGCVTIDPNDPFRVWVGTGENNSQRSVGYGDGVYRSDDGGYTWTRVGLDKSEHIGKIVVDPRDSKIVFVAAQGPLWNGGGERGLYKSPDAGKTWRRVLEIDEHTGVNDVVYDPRNPDRMLATSYQRERRQWGMVHGGAGSGMWRSTDAGETWTRVTAGLPSGDLGRIGLAVSPADPDVVYAIVEAAADGSGLYRSVNGGVSWEKRGPYVSGAPMYYNEIVADPVDVRRLYAMDTWMHVSEDGGASFRKLGETWKHVDNHALWIDPKDPEYLLAGCDGGVYESFDRGATWNFHANLPVTQFYKVTVDDGAPFYHVYGGTQDNATLGGPARTNSRNGITNADWFVTVFGDGFKTQVDPRDPNLVYSQYQYGGLVRFDRRSGELIDIQPQSGPADKPDRWHWSSPLIVSPHMHTRLYYASQRVYRSDDRGDSWRPVSPDLSKGIDRNRLEIMGKVWSVDAIAKNASTSFYGSVVSLAESPVVEGLLFAGTDDGSVHVTEDGGATWRRVDLPSGVPEGSYVTSIVASWHDAGVAYATFDNHKAGDFKPYILRSADRGRTWKSIAADLPERGQVNVVAQDHVDPRLLFAGTEFGAFVSTDDGGRWIQLRGGLPVIAVHDIAIQKRENDLVLGTFGRGFFVLDDYAALRGMTEERLAADAALFPVKDALAYVERAQLGLPGKAMQGDSFFVAPNPPFGAVFTYWLKEPILSRKEQRRKQDKENVDRDEPVAYPSWEDLRAEDREEEPTVVLTVSDSAGDVVRRVEGPATAGIHRVAWDLRYPPADPVQLDRQPTSDPFDDEPAGPMAVPGTYTVTLGKRVDGVASPLAEARTFRVVPLGLGTLAATDLDAVLAFQQDTARVQRASLGAQRAAAEADVRLQHLIAAIDATPAADAALGRDARALRTRLADLRLELDGDPTVASRNEPTAPSIVDRVQRVVYGQWSSTASPTATQRENVRIASEQLSALLPRLRSLIENDLPAVEERAESAGAPWTPGRVPRF